MVDYQKVKKKYVYWKNLGNIPTRLKFLEQIYNFRTPIYYEKTMVPWKNYGTMETLWYYGKKL